MKYTFSHVRTYFFGAALLALGSLSLGCVPAKPAPVAPSGGAAATGEHFEGDGHDHSHSGSGNDHGHSHDGGAHHEGDAHAHVLKVTTEGGEPVAGKPIELVLTVRDESGNAVTKFDVVHEHPLHLILVRDGLDEFFHVHPAVDASGVATVSFTFPTAGKWLLFADHAATGHGEAVAQTTLDVAGDARPPAPLTVNAPGKIAGEGAAGAPLSANVSVTPSADRKEAKIAFDLLAKAGGPAEGLQKYLGAAGHLVVLSADGKKYIHTHPEQTDAASHVEFDAHLPGAGIYKGWAQFKQGETVYTFPFVFEIK
ncbi:MAG TPA: hypothetical protein VGE52_20285 [Pirellulales bacterium]